MSFDWYDEQKSWVLPASGEFSGTMVIALSFVILAYFLHPAVEKAYRGVRAYQAWRAIETGQTVEVTSYPLVSEVFGGRRRWDAARIVAVLLAAFSLASWGLELQMDLAHIDDDVTDLFLRPPPVWKKSNGTGDAWYVIRQDELVIVEGEVRNMDESFSVGSAKATYEVDNKRKIIEGKVRIASWDTNVEDIKNKLFYDDTGEGMIRVKSHDCPSGEDHKNLYVDGESGPWGSVVECKNGPQKANANNASHVVKLTNEAGEVHFIVEESSTYPSFLYSVWEAKNDTDGSAMLYHVFHISSSARLVEAVVTEIVHADGDSREPTGGHSFALLRVFSENNPSYYIALEDRASPFGEQPTGERPVGIRLSSIETIEEGIKLNTTALLCAVWLMVLALVGITSSLSLRSSTVMDIYDRDELIRALTLTGSADGAEHPSKMCIFVRKEEAGNLRVVISEADFHPRKCLQRCRKKDKVVAINDPTPKYPIHDRCEPGDPVLSNKRRTVRLEGVRISKGRAYPGRRGDYRYPSSYALRASTVPYGPGSIAGTPVHQLASAADTSSHVRQFPGMDPALFDSLRPLGNCERSNCDVKMGTVGINEEPKVKPCNETGSLSPLSESITTLHDQSLMSISAELTTRSLFKISETSGLLSSEIGEDTKNDPNGYGEAEIAETESELEHDDDSEPV